MWRNGTEFKQDMPNIALRKLLIDLNRKNHVLTNLTKDSSFDKLT